MTLRLVIFDCDGVLVDSETVVARVVARELSKLGWRMNALESQRHFLGMTLSDMVPMIEARVGRLPPGWLADLQRGIVETLADGVPPVPGAGEALRAVSVLGLPWRIASNSSHAELAIKFARTGLDRLIPRDRIHSAADAIARGGRGKPAPDLFWLAAAAEGVSPAECLVVEDSAAGARAAALAGMPCLGFAPHGDGAALRAEGARPIRTLAEVAMHCADALRPAAA